MLLAAYDRVTGSFKRCWRPRQMSVIEDEEHPEELELGHPSGPRGRGQKRPCTRAEEARDDRYQCLVGCRRPWGDRPHAVRAGIRLRGRWPLRRRGPAVQRHPHDGADFLLRVLPRRRCRDADRSAMGTCGTGCGSPPRMRFPPTVCRCGPGSDSPRFRAWSSCSMRARTKESGS